MSTARHTTLLAVLAALTGCHETKAQDPERPAARPEPAEWPSYRGNPALQGVANATPGDRPTLAWTFETGDAITSSPVVAGGAVYVGSSDGSLYALDATTGKKRWSFATDDMIEAPPLVHDGRVYVGSTDYFVYALDAASGKLAWKFETGDKILGAANWATTEDGKTRIFVGSYDNNLYCFDAKTGAKLWTYETDNYVNGTPAILGDRIVFGGCDAVLHVVSATTGKALAKVELGDECHVAGSVGLADGRVYFGHYGNEFVCVDLEKREKVWSYPSRNHAFFSSPAIGADRVVFGGRDKFIHCARRGDGAEIWKFKTRRKVDGSPVIAGDKVVCGSGDGRLYMLSLAGGKELWSYEIGRAVVSSPAVAGGKIFIGANDGRLYAFRTTPAEKGR